jgi:two-component system, sensor histidine kinase PdtaS
MIKLLLPVLLFLSAATRAQSISAGEAQTLTNTLSDSEPDSTQIDILLKLAKYHVFKPGEKKEDLDSAANFIKRAENINAEAPSKRTSGYILLINSYLLKESGQRDKAKEAVAQALEILKKETDKNLAGDAYMELSGYNDYNNAELLTERIELVRSAVNCYAGAGNIHQKAASLQMLGDLYSIKGNSYIALEHLQASLDAYNSINYKQVQGIYCLMGFIYARLREFNRSIEKQLLALKTAEAVGDSSMQLCQIYNYLGETYLALTEREKAIYYYNNALEVAKKHNDVLAIYIANVNIANTLAAMNQPYKALELMKTLSSKYEKPKNNNLDYNIARCYINSYCLLKQFEKARPYANQLLDMVNTLKMSDNANVSNYTVAIRFFISAGEIGKANHYIEKHNEIAGRLKNFYYLAANQRLRFMLDTTRHDYKRAVVHLLEFNRFNDSALLETKNRQISELNVQFETEKKENTIAAKNKDIAILTKESQLQESRIEKDRQLRIFMITGVGLLLLILALVYRGYIIKKKNTQVLTMQRAQINDQNIRLQAVVREQEKLIDEKEWLLKEIHHRVKNNLQIVMSLLNSQSVYIDNDAALTAIHDSQHRVHAMSLIHQRLYGSENVSSVDMPFYIRDLVSYLNESFAAGNRIRFELNIEPIEMDVSQAVPLGLILNEAITNSIKYAFPDGRNGVISISLAQVSAQDCLLTIADNGIGTSLRFSNEKPGSLGMSLMAGLSEDLDGNFSIENNNGTTIKILFLKDWSAKRTNTAASTFASNN